MRDRVAWEMSQPRPSAAFSAGTRPLRHHSLVVICAPDFLRDFGNGVPLLGNALPRQIRQRGFDAIQTGQQDQSSSLPIIHLMLQCRYLRF